MIWTMAFDPSHWYSVLTGPNCFLVDISNITSDSSVLWWPNPTPDTVPSWYSVVAMLYCRLAHRFRHSHGLVTSRTPGTHVSNCYHGIRGKIHILDTANWWDWMRNNDSLYPPFRWMLLCKIWQIIISIITLYTIEVYTQHALEPEFDLLLLYHKVNDCPNV